MLARSSKNSRQSSGHHSYALGEGPLSHSYPQLLTARLSRDICVRIVRSVRKLGITGDSADGGLVRRMAVCVRGRLLRPHPHVLQALAVYTLDAFGGRCGR